MDNLFEITDQAISVDAVIARLADPANGAVATFVGVVRGQTDGRETLYLEYEVHPEMAERMLAQIAREVQTQWSEIRQVVVVHRIGHLDVGETAIVIALCAAHRRQVFEALHYAINRIKEVVPIWKKEITGDGAEWKSEV